MWKLGLEQPASSNATIRAAIRMARPYHAGRNEARRIVSRRVKGLDMGEPTPPFFWINFFIFGVMVLFYNVVVLYMFSYLKRVHPEAWADIGSPSLLNNSIKNNFLFFGFLLSRKYRVLGDQKLNQLCLVIWILFGVCLLMFLSWLPTIFQKS
jgi:hypothetical protein